MEGLDRVASYLCAAVPVFIINKRILEAVGCLLAESGPYRVLAPLNKSLFNVSFNGEGNAIMKPKFRTKMFMKTKSQCIIINF